jgi:MFS superfamily sulfate permease-like transporter
VVLYRFLPPKFSWKYCRFNSHITRGAVFISFISLAILIFLKQPKNKKYNILPASLVVVIFGIVINYLLTYFGSSYALKTNQLVNIPSNIFAELKFPDFTKILSNIEIWKNGLLIGVLATLETLLSIEAMDKLDKHNRITPVNRELMAQGVGNFFCGLLGAIPLTAVVVRGSANIQAGAKTKVSSFVHGVFLLLSVLLIPFLINLIPYASLSAILILTGFGLTKIKIYKSLFNLGWKQFVPFIITIVIILATDLLIGVSIGLLISIYYIIKENFKESYDLEKTHYQGIDQYILKLQQCDFPKQSRN